MENRLRFVIEALDESTRSISDDETFEVDGLNELRSLLAIEDFDPADKYELEADEFERIRARFKLNLDRKGRPVFIRPWNLIDALPYKIHTNRELALMLAGTKPLAAFVGLHPSNPEVLDVPQEQFAPYVASGRFSMREEVIEDEDRKRRRPGLRRVLYARPGHEWRIEAYLLLWATSEKSGWNEGFERMEGSLLGYTDEQNDLFIETIHRPAVAARRKDDELK